MGWAGLGWVVESQRSDPTQAKRKQEWFFLFFFGENLIFLASLTWKSSFTQFSSKICSGFLAKAVDLKIWRKKRRIRIKNFRRKITSPILTTPSEKEISFLQTTRHFRNSEGVGLLQSENRKTGSGSSPEKEEDRNYARRGSGADVNNTNGKAGSRDGGGGERKGIGVGDEENRSNSSSRRIVWPKLYITLSTKEKEEDFMAMKGCKPPHRPKKRAKIIQRTLLLVSPGAWLTDMCQERYEVREKRSSKKRPRGLKAMGSMESDSE
ncbi:hypothetical protein Vadar_020686 [Vaccinium darrowii]|uniref:Uncharacterized protein n=1 Tax=Vaccinium darrowii TaxID=229202 RepID=A0ACB7YQG8_9ERIC|nr:hypothetical protein Vadar_020686 [Vaccinium darrowii]